MLVIVKGNIQIWPPKLWIYFLLVYLDRPVKSDCYRHADKIIMPVFCIKKIKNKLEIQ